MQIKKFIATTVREYLNENEFGFGEFPKPKKEVYIQLLNRARKDGLLSDLHYSDKRIKQIAIEIAKEFEEMEELDRQSNKDLFLGLFYQRIPKWAWEKPTYNILKKYNLGK